MKNQFVFNLLFCSLLSAPALAATDLSLVCAITATKTHKKSASVNVNLNKKLEDFYSGGDVDVTAKDNYSFDLVVEKTTAGITLNVTFYENKHVQDEVGSAAWGLTKAELKAAKNGDVLLTEPLESEGDVVGEFACLAKR